MIVILGVLSSVSVFAVRGISSRGEAAACQADVKSLEKAIEVWRVQHPGTDTVSEDNLVQAGLLRSPSSRHDVIDALDHRPDRWRRLRWPSDDWRNHDDWRNDERNDHKFREHNDDNGERCLPSRPVGGGVVLEPVAQRYTGGEDL